MQLAARVVFVCVGNICRSPLAEAVWRAAVAGRADVATESAGVEALIGMPADPMAVALGAERGLDLAPHRARQLTQDLVQRASLVLVMDSGQQRWIESRWPMARGRVHLLGRWGGFEVPDPYRRGEAEFRSALALIERGCADWLARVGGPVGA